MKQVIIVLIVLGFRIAEAVPHQPFTVKEFSGVVEMAVWRGSFELNRVFATPKGEPQNEWIDTVPEHWVIVLKDTKGLTDSQRNQISWAYNRLPIDGYWRYFTKHLQNTHLYLWVSAPKDWPVKIESTVTVKNLNYAGSDFDGEYTVGEVVIDNVIVKLPEKQLLPGWRTVEQQAGAAQPAAKPADKILTYALPLAIIACGTVTQGDDGPWQFSLFILAPLAAIGAVILWIRRSDIRKLRWMSVIHIVTLIAAVRVLPGYWSRVTIAGDHIGAGFSRAYVGAFHPEPWHSWWAPTMTGLSMAIAALVIYAFIHRKAEQAVPSDGQKLSNHTPNTDQTAH